VAKTPSLKIRAFLLSILVVGSVWSVTAWFAYQSSSEAVNQLIDDQLRHEMTLVQRNVSFAIAYYEKQQPDISEILWDIEGRQPGRAVFFWARSGTWSISSKGAPEIAQPEKPGYSTRVLTNASGSREWRVLYEYSETNIAIAVAADTDIAGAYLREIGLQTLRPLLIALVISGISVLLGFTISWKPIRELIGAVTARSPTSLAPIRTHEIPSELRPLVDALNVLMGRLERALESEQQFTANAAHELQTPLAAISTEVQLCQRKTKNPEVAEMLERIAERVDRGTAMVRQLLMLARLEASEFGGGSSRVDLNAMLVDAISNIAHLLIESGHDIHFDDSSSAIVKGDAQLLGVLIKNLLDNALQYASEQGTIQVRIGTTDTGQVQLSIANETPPISSQQRRKMLDTFYRIPGTRGSGSGIGLSIVKRITEIHEAQLDIEDWLDGDGINIVVTFV